MEPNIPRKTSSGLDENVAGLLCYILTFVTGIIFVLIEKDSRFVRFHALQSIFTFLPLFVAQMILAGIPFIGWIFSSLIGLLIFILWIVTMIQAFQGKWFKLPLVGDLVEKQLNK
ncbi:MULTISPECIES: DUF4870 domain-containing protein [unclassified Paenibacillus]|uniref:DUF4870 domain-containing protein n=1 Tax=unclassified Paenibacillus TaxID=185978 RepID=UPI001C127E7A|nr:MULTISPECIES: DUF4870 domain-containing protein [unclassified Paenibacillus]MBU5441037.1 DUF4870 domain-containing protein [Paenibacillus sp. MSJ-34]CAH0117973.1 hypothetical protein PAE9249_00438 [Paenibacillus sp. CECT 9249]